MLKENKNSSSKIIFKNQNFEFYTGNKEQSYEFKINKEKKLILIGTVNALFYENKIIEFSNTKLVKKIIKKIFTKKNNFPLDVIEGSFVGLLIKSEDDLIIFGDKLNRKDLYFINKKKLVVSTSIKELIPSLKIIKYDQVALANMISVYGNYTPKKHTIYKDIHKLGVGEKISCSRGKIKIKKLTFKPKVLNNFTEKKLDEYYKLFYSSVKIRSSKNINWVYMSSGWDSSSVLATLCAIHGPSKVRAVIGKFKYSKKSGVNNNFEINRAKKITNFFKIKLDVVDIDYTASEYLIFWNKIRENFKSNHIYAFFAYNFFKLAVHIRKYSDKNDAVFNGEISDGAHNLGFCQFATTLNHEDLNFREYSDKMASYLFGPTFFRSIENNTYSNDTIFELLKKFKNEKDIKNLSKKDWKTKYIFSFFLSKNRIPFSETAANDILTSVGKRKYFKEISSTYFKDFSERVNYKNLYAWLLYLYNSFHWQASGVRSIMISPEYHSLKSSTPFWDTRLQEFLSSMPENWGRGLDLNTTKFPLKWMLKNKVNYPNHLQTGPHSYLYDTNPSWSANSDIIYSPANSKFFKSLLKTRSYKQILSPKFFNLNYLDKIVEDYLRGKVETGKKLSDLTNLISICNIGWY